MKGNYNNNFTTEISFFYDYVPVSVILTFFTTEHLIEHEKMHCSYWPFNVFTAFSISKRIHREDEHVDKYSICVPNDSSFSAYYRNNRRCNISLRSPQNMHLIIPFKAHKLFNFFSQIPIRNEFMYFDKNNLKRFLKYVWYNRTRRRFEITAVLLFINSTVPSIFVFKSLTKNVCALNLFIYL